MSKKNRKSRHPDTHIISGIDLSDQERSDVTSLILWEFSNTENLWTVTKIKGEPVLVQIFNIKDEGMVILATPISRFILAADTAVELADAVAAIQNQINQQD